MNTLKTLLILGTSLSAVLLLSAPVKADPPMMGSDEMRNQMMQQGGPGYGMGYGRMGMMGGRGMGYGGMGMMGGGMGYGGMGMMGGGMGYGGMGMMGAGMSPMMMQLLDLDDKQKAKLREISREQRNSRCANMNAMMDIRDELAEAYDKDQLDTKAIGKVYGKMFDMKRQMIEQSLEARNKMRAVLNKEQKEKFDTMMHGGGMGMMGGGMGYGGMGMMNMMGGGMGPGGMGMME